MTALVRCVRDLKAFVDGRERDCGLIFVSLAGSRDDDWVAVVARCEGGDEFLRAGGRLRLIARGDLAARQGTGGGWLAAMMAESELEVDLAAAVAFACGDGDGGRDLLLTVDLLDDLLIGAGLGERSTHDDPLRDERVDAFDRYRNAVWDGASREHALAVVGADRFGDALATCTGWLLARSVMSASQPTPAQTSASMLATQLTQWRVLDQRGAFGGDAEAIPREVMAEWLDRLDLAAPGGFVREARQHAREWCRDAAPSLPAREALKLAGAVAVTDAGGRGHGSLASARG